MAQEIKEMMVEKSEIEEISFRKVWWFHSEQ